ncbi:MAG: site-specific integrase [Bacteroidales bacterium]|jgi:integrase
MESNVKITFWLRASKKTVDKMIPIYLRVWYNYEFFTKTTGITVKLSDWDKKAMRIKGNNETANTTNNQMDALRVKVLQIINQLSVSGKPFNLHTIKKHLDRNEANQMTLMRLIDDHLKEMRKLLGKDYTKSTLIKYSNTRLRVQQFLRYKYKRSDIYLYELNYSFISDWIIYLKNKYENSTTTCYKHFQRLTRIIKKAISYGYMEKHPFPDYKIRMPKKRIEYLTQDEVNRIEQTDFSVNRLNTIRDIFIFCCYSGMAYAEVESLTPENLTQGIDNELWLNITRKKTGKQYQIPLLPKALEILRKYKSHPLCLKKGRLLPVPSNVKYNAYLKEIADIADIKKYLTTHLARKTFASTIMLGNGVNIAVLSKILGHASVQVTLDCYASVVDELLLKNVKDLKQKLNPTNESFDISGLLSPSVAHDDLVYQAKKQSKN